MLLVVFMDRIESNRIYPRDMLLPLLAFSAFVGEVSIHELKDASGCLVFRREVGLVIFETLFCCC